MLRFLSASAAFAGGLAILLSSPRADASEPAPHADDERLSAKGGANADTTPELRPSTLHALDFMVTAGVFEDTGGGPGVVAAGNVLYRRGWLALGGTVERGGQVLDGYEYVGAAPAAGINLPTPRWLTLSALGTMGVHHYWDVGRQFLGDDPGTSGNAAFIGGRLFAGGNIGFRGKHATIGVVGFADTDLARTTRHYEYTDRHWGAAPPTARTAAHEIGSSRLGAMLTVGGSFNL